MTRAPLFLALVVMLFSACATHAPMSELVMFDKATITDSAQYIRSGVVTYLQPGITLTDFEENKEGDYGNYSDLEYPSITLNTFILRRKDISRSLSLGRGLGVDWTKNLKENYFGTIALSVPYSTKITVHRVFLNKRWVGFSSGFFSGWDSRRYNSICDDDGSNCSFWPDRTALLFNSGIRSRFLIRDPKSPGLVITGALEVGYIWNILEPFLGFNISVSSFE
ncbi:MAG: hypothetical protein BalsKO_31360 [Balneolaceae bacterium]